MNLPDATIEAVATIPGREGLIAGELVRARAAIRALLRVPGDAPGVTADGLVVVVDAAGLAHACLPEAP